MATLTDQRFLLAHLRLAVLIEGEKQPNLWWSSTGLSPEGQRDLIHIFPRTAITAAATQANALALAHHDKNTRSSGVYHLFRLPTVYEEEIHRDFVTDLSKKGQLFEDPWSLLSDLETTGNSAQEGAINLGEIDLRSIKHLSLLASTYRAALEAKLSCTPFFTLRP